MNKVKANIELDNIKLEINLNNVIRSVNIKSIKKLIINDIEFNFGIYQDDDLTQFEDTYKKLNEYLENNNIDAVEVEEENFDFFTFVAFKSYETKKLALKFAEKLKGINLSLEETYYKILLSLIEFTDDKAFERMRNNAYVLLFDFNDSKQLDSLEKVLKSEGLDTIYSRGVVWNFSDLKNYFRKSFSPDSTYPEFNVTFTKREN